MEFDKSSLLGLKAELLRKQKEVENAKASNQAFVRPIPKVKLKNISEKVNEGVEKRDRLDALESEVPGDLMLKSQKMLEAKSKLYDQLSSQGSAKDTSSFLVNFDAKEKISNQNKEENSEFENDSDSDSDWVEFVDCLGRTRRCLKEDLAEMKKKDADLGLSQSKGAPLFKPAGGVDSDAPIMPMTEAQVEMLSADMQRELLRQKWEQKEQELLGARDVHYQDLLFDEARQHGVGYYAFSTDEAERQRQQQELKNLRKQTEEERLAHQVAQTNKKKQLEQRLKAARRRKRERLGLPPEDDSEEEIEEPPLPPPPAPAERTEEPIRNFRKPTQIREWDIGKEDSSRVLSQEEWVAKKREERPSEFAPPTISSENKEKSKEKHNERQAMRITTYQKTPKIPQEDVSNLSFKFNHPPPSPVFHHIPSQSKRMKSGVKESLTESSGHSPWREPRDETSNLAQEYLKDLADPCSSQFKYPPPPFKSNPTFKLLKAKDIAGGDDDDDDYNLTEINHPPWSKPNLNLPQESMEDITQHSSFKLYMPPPPVDIRDINPFVAQKRAPDEPEIFRKGAEIPPPECLDTTHKPKFKNLSDIEKSVEQGLLFLRQQAEKKSQRSRDFEIL